MSKFPVDIQERTRAKAMGPNKIRATAPLYGIAIGLPALTTYAGKALSSIAGASTETSCPALIKYSAKSLTWLCTPPGVSQLYGQTSPIFNFRLIIGYAL